jgi:hypothetical protein
MVKILKTVMILILFFWIIAGGAVFAYEFPPPGSNVAEQALLQKKIERLIIRLDAKTWKQRKKASQELLDTLSKHPYALRFVLFATSKSKEPEIRFKGREILKRYFRQHEYDPNRKMGFIGISLASGGVFRLEGESYVPIRVVFTQSGFPGEKAGIKPCDLILSIDGIKCSRNFSISAFVEYVSSKSPGDKINLLLYSRGAKVKLPVVLGARPEGPGMMALKKSENELFNAWLKSIAKKIPQSSN